MADGIATPTHPAVRRAVIIVAGAWRWQARRADSPARASVGAAPSPCGAPPALRHRIPTYPELPREFGGADDAHLSDRAQRQQIPIAGDRVVGPPERGVRDEVVILGVAHDGGELLRERRKPFSNVEGHVGEPLEISRRDPLREVRLCLHPAYEFCQQGIGNEGVNVLAKAASTGVRIVPCPDEPSR